MKYLPFLLWSLFIISCNQKNTENLETEVEKGKFLWTAEWTNGVQENPKDMTKTVYVLLSTTDEADAICDKNNLLKTAVYKEIWKNDHTVKNPVWNLKKGESMVLNYDDVFQEFCENDQAIYGIVDLHKFNYPYLDRYPLFHEK